MMLLGIFYHLTSPWSESLALMTALAKEAALPLVLVNVKVGFMDLTAVKVRFTAPSIVKVVVCTSFAHSLKIPVQTRALVLCWHVIDFH